MPTPNHRPAAAAPRGAPLGNTNALKHGFYSRTFRSTEQTDLAALTDAASLENEIQLMRVFILRIAQQETDGLSFTESLALLNVLSRASLSLGSLLRTQRATTIKNFHTELEELFVSGRLAYTRANSLIEQITAAAAATRRGAAPAELQTAPTAQDDESDQEDCRPPIDCLTCPEIATCPDAPPKIRDLILSLKLFAIQPDSSEPTPPPPPPTQVQPPVVESPSPLAV